MPDWEYNDDSQPSQPTAPKAGGWEYLDAVPTRREINGVEAAKAVFPDITPTSGYRGPNNPLSKKNPKSFHALTHRAVDLPPIPGMTFEQAAAKFREQGYILNPDSRDEVNNPVSWQTGPHWHFVFDGGPETGILQNKVVDAAEPEKPATSS